MRIVSLSPNVTEIIFALGAGDSLVGVTAFCDYPTEAKRKTRVGGLIDTNFELILSLKPDLVIDLESQSDRVAKLGSLGLKTVTVANETIEDIQNAITDLGAILDKREQADELKSEMIESMAEIRSKVQGLERPKVAYVCDHSPGALQDVFVAGRDNFINELVQIAGGKNVFADIGSGYPQVGIEAFLKLNPDIIFDATERAEDVYSDITELKAVREGRVYFCFDDIIQVPGPRLPQSMKYIAMHLHPEAF